MAIKRRYVFWLVVAVVVALAAWAFTRPTIVEVEAADVVRAPLRVTIDEEGETRLRRRFVISAPVSGRVLRIESRPGDSVKAGQIVAVIEPAAPVPLDARTRAGAEARVQTAEAAIERVRAERQKLTVDRQQAEIDAARAKQLYDAGYGSREIWEQATADIRAQMSAITEPIRKAAAQDYFEKYPPEIQAMIWEQAAARLQSLTEAIRATEAAGRAAEFEAAAAKSVLISGAEQSSGRAVSVPAPTSGLILKRMQESEAVVTPGAPLLEIGNLDDLEIVTDLLSTDAVKVKPGAKVEIDRWGGQGTLAAVVQRVEPSGFMKISALGVEEQRVNVIVDFVDPREKRASLGDGYRVEVRIVTWEKPDALTVPTSSLFRTDGQWSVFLIDGETVKRQPVKIGERNERAAEVLEGLSPGQQVVAYPGESLAEGVLIQVREK